MFLRARRSEYLHESIRMAGPLLVIEGVLLASFDIWTATTLLPQGFPPAVLVVLIVIAALLSVLVLAGTLVVRGLMALRRPQRPVMFAGLRLQVLAVTAVYAVWLMGTAPWLLGLGAGVVVATAVVLILSLLPAPSDRAGGGGAGPTSSTG
jgi:hypothetical protein